MSAVLLAAALAAGVAVALALPPASADAARSHGGAGVRPGWLMVPAGFLAFWWPPALAAGLLGWGGHRLYRRVQDRRARAANAARVLETCDLVASELAAGRTSGAVLEEAAAAWPALTPVARASTLGLSVPDAFRKASTLPGGRDLELLAAGWEVGQSSGAGLADLARLVAQDLRAESATRRTVEAELASARATAWLVSGLPLLALLLATASGGDPWSFLFGTTIGTGCLVGGIGLGLAGLWWIDALAARAARR